MSTSSVTVSHLTLAKHTVVGVRLDGGSYLVVAYVHAGRAGFATVQAERGQAVAFIARDEFRCSGPAEVTFVCAECNQTHDACGLFSVSETHLQGISQHGGVVPFDLGKCARCVKAAYQCRLKAELRICALDMLRVASAGRMSSDPRITHLQLALTAQGCMIAHVADPLTIPALAERCNSSPTVLKESFRQVFGCPVYSWFRAYRVYQAARMLRESYIPVSEVAQQVGYANPSKFTKAFCDVMHVTPRTYREAVQHEEGWEQALSTHLLREHTIHQNSYADPYFITV